MFWVGYNKSTATLNLSALFNQVRRIINEQRNVVGYERPRRD
jgi:hypothetical protein